MHIVNLKVFCDLVETSSFSGSAERNGITQSAVSQQIKSLEESYQVTFFERGKKNFSITPEGLVFYAAAQKILAISNGIDGELRAVRNQIGGILRISTVYSIGLHELPPLVKRFRTQFPEVDVQVQYKKAAEVYTDVHDERTDIGLVAYPKARRGLAVETFAQDRMVFICPPGHRLASDGRTNIEWRELNGLAFISFEPDLPTRKAVDQMLRDQHVTIRQTMELDNIETVKRAVAIETGVSIVPLNSVRAELTSGQLIAMEIGEAPIWRPMGLIQRRGRVITPALREFVDNLRTYGQKHGNGEGLGPITEDEE
jgi:LysR family transcriptional regulator, transcriptional activator of the cysJI operon